MTTHIVRDWALPLTVDLILAGQGADPDVIRRRRPQLITLAERVLEEASSWIHPQMAYRRVAVASVEDHCLNLEEGSALTAAPLVEHLKGTQYVIVFAVTIGLDLETRITELMTADPPYALALDGLGTVAVDALYRAAYRYLEMDAVAHGLNLSRPLSPGMVGWPLDEGQRWLFTLLDPGAVGISLLSSGQMRPRKSCSALVGVGRDVAPYKGRPCSTCPMRATCAYKQRHTISI